jgi:hypothetical protein
MSVALITGASAGIGQALCEHLAEDEQTLILVARRADRLRRLADDLTARHGVVCHVVPMDLAQPGAADEIAARVAALGLQVDVLVNDAGFGQYGAFVEQPAEKARDMILVNVLALTELTRLLLPGMITRGRGRVLQVASTAAFQPGPRMAVYYATKAYVLSFAEALSVELRGTGVTVTTLCPGPTTSEFMDVASFPVNGLIARSMMTAEQVAAIGYRAMRRGERLAIAGAHNKAAALASQLGPRSLVLAVVDRVLRSRGGPP